jgi:D-alanine-D-alanine ligase
VAGIPYVGSGQRASTIAMDKQVCKAYMRDFGILTPKGQVVNNAAELDTAAVTGPVCVKPNAGGSSVAVTILREPDADSLCVAVEAALADGSQALIEELIEGVEITAAVIGQGKDARVLPIIEIVSQSEAGFYDYEAKYAPGGSEHLTPPRISEAAQATIAHAALAAHAALGCRGVSRSDFIVDAAGTPYFLETNTLPGMTGTSLVPDAARAAGISFEELVETLIMQALPK